MLLGTPNIRYTKPGGIAVTEGSLGIPSMDDAITWGKEQAEGAAGSAGKKALDAARKKGGAAMDRARSKIERQVHEKTGISIAEKKVRVSQGFRATPRKGGKKKAKAGRRRGFAPPVSTATYVPSPSRAPVPGLPDPRDPASKPPAKRPDPPLPSIDRTPKDKPSAADDVVTKVQGNKMFVVGASVIVLGGLMLMLRK